MEKLLGNNCGGPVYWADRNVTLGLPNNPDNYREGDHKAAFCFKLGLFFLLIFFVKTPVALSQTLPIFTEKIKNFTTDNLGNVYTLTLDNQIVKYSPEGVEQFRYPNRTLGGASLLDATNPFHLLLFFPEYQTVLTLDRTLSVTGQFNLFQLGFQAAKAVGTSSDGRMWVYDETDFLLKKIESDGTVIAKSADLSLAIGQPLHPAFLVEREQTVFLNDPKIGVLVFDAFGQYQKTIPILGLSEFQVIDEQLVFFREGQLWSFHMKALLERPFSLPFELGMATKVQVMNGILLVLENNDLIAHRI